jgi:hypothetical protein
MLYIAMNFVGIWKGTYISQEIPGNNSRMKTQVRRMTGAKGSEFGVT